MASMFMFSWEGKPPSILLRNIGAHGVGPIVSTFSSSTGRENKPLIRCMIGNIVLISESAKTCFDLREETACRMYNFLLL
jgi:hypothetical protein